MYAIVESGGKQYKVSKGQKIKIDKLKADIGEKYIFDKIILVVDENNNLLMNDNLSSASIDASVVSHGKCKKLVVYKYKPKKGFHKKKGHRQKFTEIKIKKIAV